MIHLDSFLLVINGDGSNGSPHCSELGFRILGYVFLKVFRTLIGICISFE